MAVTTEIPWGDGSGDKIYLTRNASEGDQVVQVSSDANSGNARSKVVTFTSGVGNIVRQLTINQAASGSSGGDVSDYVQNGLVLLMDGKTGKNGTTWESVVGNVVFTNNGATFNEDHVYFDGVNDYLNNTSFDPSLSETGTIEVVIDNESFGGGMGVVFMGKTSACLGFGTNASKQILWSCGGSTKRQRPVASLAKASFSISNQRMTQNGVVMTTNGSNYLGNQNSTNWIGRRNTGNYFKGKIYSIRIYNRQLDSNEVAQNLSVDNIRFNLGLQL